MNTRRYIHARYEQEGTDKLSLSSPGVEAAGRFDNWLAFFVVFAILEGVFYDVITPYVTNRSVFIFRLTPFNLYPTDLVLIPFSLCLVLFARGRNDTQANRGSLLWWWWATCIMAVVVGALNQNYYLSADIRNYMLRSVLAFTLYRLALEANLTLVLDKVIRASVVIAIGLILIRFFMLIGTGPFNIQTSVWGTHALLLPYCILIMRILLKETPFYRALPALILIAIGILQAFWKPAVLGFLIAPLLTIFLPLYSEKTRVSGFKKLQRILPAFLLIIVFGGLFLSTNYDYYFRLFRYFYLKEGFVIQDYSGNRFSIWAQVIDMWIQSPIFGSGFGSVLRGYLLLSGLGKYVYLDQIYVHNIAIQFLYQFGVFGLSIVVILLVRWYILIRSTMRIVSGFAAGSYAGIVLFCILTLVISLVGEALRYSPAGFLFWAALGLEAAFAVHIQRAEISAPPVFGR